MSKLNITVDKRQMPQVIVLGALSFGLIGYFSMRLLTPSSQAGAASAAATVGPGSTVRADVKNLGGALPAAQGPDTSLAALTDGTAPDAGMRDPFIPVVTDDKDAPTAAVVKTASTATAPDGLTPGPGLPASSGVRPLPAFGAGIAPGTPGTLVPLAAPIAAPTWTVTGVVAGPDPDAGRIAILRQGDVRRFVRLGAMVDDQYRLIDVDRTGVVLGVGKTHFRLALGGDAAKTPHAPVANGAASGFLSGSAPTAVPSAAGAPPQASTEAPAQTAAGMSAAPSPVEPASPAANDTDAFLNAAASGKGPQ